MGQPKPALPADAYVSLCEALTWIAFGDPMKHDVLQSQVEGPRPSTTIGSEERLRKFFAGAEGDMRNDPGLGYFHDRKAGLTNLSEAWRELRNEVDRGCIHARGRFTSTYSLTDASLSDVEKLTGDILATFSQLDVSTGGIRRQPAGSPDILWRDDPLSFDREFEAFCDDARAGDGYLEVEVARADLISRWPNPAKYPRKSHQQVVDWCRQWIEAGRGHGHDKAWAEFSSLTEHAGLSRDDVFRPAFKEAKIRS